jgi:hypothetical protein
MTFADRAAVVEVVSGPAFELVDTRRAWDRRVRLAALQAVGGLTVFVVCIVVWQPDSAASVPNAFAMVGWLAGLLALLLGAASSIVWFRARSTLRANPWRECASFGVAYFRSTYLQFGDDGPVMVVQGAFSRRDDLAGAAPVSLWIAWSDGGWAVVSPPGGENLILARQPRVPLVTRLIGRRVARARSARP